ncbi:DUF1403 family protein [Methylocystis sp. B8]|uniref:DUF1403 family protein n=1 Tax=Methylocystis sp. B8 TaxID=544938 RepID=UPI0010FDBF5F|nr:DUF1403 family protein [Methylocystis sp. B8]TLG72653.1 DUF1403 family protein [Methylocystis sp. B8]
MLEDDSDALFDPPAPSTAMAKRRRRIRDDSTAAVQKSLEIQPFPSWARLRTNPVDNADAAADAVFAAGASLARLDQIMRSGADISRAGIGSADVSSAGKNFGTDGAEPVFVGALRQRLALRAAVACATIARLREDEGALRDAEHLAGFNAALTPGGRLHRLWRLFAMSQGQNNARLDAAFMRTAADCLELPPHINVTALVDLAEEASTVGNPLNAAARVSAASLQSMSDAPQIDAEIFALWLADLVLARRLAWAAPLPLLATVVTHPSLRTASNRRPRPSDPDWSVSVARAAARAAQDAYALASELARRSDKLLSVTPKLRAKRAERVVTLLLDDDCVSPARAAKAGGLSERASRRLFDRLVALGAVRELTGRANFRLYGL